MPGRTLIVHPAFVAVHGVIVVPGSVYPAAQERISWVPLVLSVLKPIQLIPLSELTFKRWLKPTGLLMLVRLGLPIPCAQCGQLADGLEEWQVYGPDPVRKLFVMGSKIGLSARTPPTIAMLGAPKSPTQLSSEAFTMFVPATFLPVTPVFQVLAPQADQTWPGMMVTSPMRSSVNGPLALRFRSRVYSSSTLMWEMLASDVAW